MPYDLTKFYRLSAGLTYQLSALGPANQTVLATILDGRSVPKSEEMAILDLLKYLEGAFKAKQRRLGSLAMLHPLRATVQLIRAENKVDLLNVFTTMLHDKMEDITADKYKDGTWPDLERKFEHFMTKYDIDGQLNNRLIALTRNDDENYYQYIGRLLDEAQTTEELVRIKLADRLDNTLDLRIELKDTLDGVDFFQDLVHLISSKHFEGFPISAPHPPSSTLNGAQRMYQLFKNAVLLSLIRQKAPDIQDPATVLLFNSIATASKREAQRIVMHILTYHKDEISNPRDLIVDSMSYCKSGGVDSITSHHEPHQLDGLFVEWFESPSSKIRNERIAHLYENKTLMVAGSIAFITIFLNFLSNPTYFIEGISSEGIRPRADLV